MALINYILNGPRTVIEADSRDPFVSWRHHIERTRNSARGGVDLVAPVGTPVYAPTDGRMRQVPNDGGAGNSSRFEHRHNVGWSDVFSHLSRYVGANLQQFRQGDLIAFSGDSGDVAQHLHRHLLDPRGNRRNPWDHFSKAALAMSSVTPVNLRKEISKMKLVWDTNGTGYLCTEDGVAGLASPQVYNLFYRLINANQAASPFVNNARPDTFNKAEMDIINANLRLLAVSVNTQVGIDVPKLVRALSDALGKTFNVTADIDPAELAAAFDTAVPRIAKAVTDEAAKRLAL